MKFSTTLPLAALTTATSAAFTADFVLKTTGSTNPSFNNWFVGTFYTGSGTNAVWMEDQKSFATGAALDANNKLHFDGQAIVGADDPFSMEFQKLDKFASWQPVQINQGQGGKFEFEFEGEKLVSSSQGGFNGWVVCDWWYANPQLFWATKSFEVEKLPASCGKVDLVKVDV